MNILLTGCCGFIATHLVKQLKSDGHTVYGYDALTSKYSQMRLDSSNFAFYEVKFKKIEYVDRLEMFGVDLIINMASETFVDTSIQTPEVCIHSNYVGTFRMLELARSLKIPFLQVSTDEVYGSAEWGQFFTESDRLNAGNPYSATKAGADLLCMSYVNTYGMDIRIVRPENNFGIWQAPEKAIPTWISACLRHEDIPLYGDGGHERMWLHAGDCGEAIIRVMNDGQAGEIYNIGGQDSWQNLLVVKSIMHLTKTKGKIKYIPDEVARKGHDRKYAIGSSKIRSLGWKPTHKLADQLPFLVKWYKENPQWQK